MMNATLSQQWFLPSHDNRLIKTIQTIPHMSEFKVGFPLLWIKAIMVDPLIQINGYSLIGCIWLCWNPLDEPQPLLLAGAKAFSAESGTRQRL